ncbi:MAG TPA: tripartite tricarboxylate transporter substrate-binding protein [Xanthobacteraceae bacterium]|nr:tripartite tricarboxylate transporter substrate-binding protein [Xanthobacteraceae bacterium]
MATTITRRSALAGLSALSVGAAHPVRAQSARPITLIHGFTPGANVDITARLVADGLSRRLGQPFVVEPRPGAGGTTAAAAVARAAPDGLTLAALPSGHAVSPALYKRLPYNAVDDFTFISMLTENPFILVTSLDHPAKTVADVLKSAQAEPGKLTCATAGNGTGMHLALELLSSMGKVKIQHVPYRGSPQGITDLIAGRVDFQMDTPQFLLTLLREKKVRALAVTGPSRFFALPDVPTVAESGLPGYSVTGWLGLAGPPGLPKDFVERVNAEVKALLAEPEAIARLRALGADVKPTTPEGYKKRVADDIVKWTKVIADANIPRI